MSSGSSSSDPMLVSRYLLDFKADLDRQFPAGEIGDTDYVFHSDYVSRDNKRRVVLFVTRGPRTVTRATYILPVSAMAAPLFRLEGADPAVAAVFSEMNVPAAQSATDFIAAYAAGNNLARWGDELVRIQGLATTTPPGKLQRAYHNLGVYWRNMRRRIQDAIMASSVGITRTLSDRTISSASRRTSSDTFPGSQRSSTPRTSSRRATGRRTSSRRSSSRRSSSRRPSSDPAKVRRRPTPNPGEA